MAIITFWSNNKKSVGQSLSTGAVALYMSMEHNNKCLALSTQYEDNAFERAFGVTAHTKAFLKNILKGKDTGLDGGIEGLTKMAVSNRLSPELIPNYTKVAIKTLEVLTGPKKIDDTTDYEKILNSYKSLISNANKYYDMVFVDLNKTLELPQTRVILEMSDIIVVDIEQKMEKINEFIALREQEPIFQGKNVMLLINKYDKFSQYNTKNISRYLGEKKEIYSVPYNTLYFEAAEEGGVVDLFFRIRKVDEADRNAFFIQELKRVTDAIIYKLQELHMRV
jgi:hypothetical protein